MSLKIALIGCGELATSYYAPALLRLRAENTVTLAACVDCDAGKSANFAKKFGFSSNFVNGDVMLQEIQPDCLLLATPVELTSALAIHYSQYGIPMMIEKPPALTVAEGKGLETALARNHVLHQIAFNRHYMPLVKELKTAIEGETGIQNIQILMSRCGRTAENFFTTAIHSIDLAQHLANSVYKSVKISYQKLPHYADHVYNYYLDCVFENGITSQLTILVCSGIVSERVMVTGNDTTWFLKLPVWECSDSPGQLAMYRNDVLQYEKNGVEISDGSEPAATNGFYGELKAFFACVREGRQPSETMQYALGPVAIAQLLRDKKEYYTKEI